MSDQNGRQVLQVSLDEAERIRQWFGAVQDLNPSYLARADYQLADRIYSACHMRVPNSIATRVRERFGEKTA